MKKRHYSSREYKNQLNDTIVFTKNNLSKKVWD